MLTNFKKQYSAEISKYSSMKASERNALALAELKKMQSGDKTAFERFLKIDYMLIYKLYLSSNTGAFADSCDPDEYEMYFIERLYNVLMRFDFDKGTQISTFIYKSLQKDNHAAMIGRNMIPVTMPLDTYMRAKQIQMDYNNLRDKGHRDAYIYRVMSEKHNMPANKIRAVLAQIQQIHNTVCFDDTVKEADTSTYADIVADPKSLDFLHNMFFNIDEFLEDCKKELTAEEYYVLITHLGLHDEIARDFSYLSAEMHKSRQRVQQIFAKATNKARLLMYRKYRTVAETQDGFDYDLAYKIDNDNDCK